MLFLIQFRSKQLLVCFVPSESSGSFGFELFSVGEQQGFRVYQPQVFSFSRGSEIGRPSLYQRNCPPGSFGDHCFPKPAACPDGKWRQHQSAGRTWGWEASASGGGKVDVDAILINPTVVPGGCWVPSESGLIPTTFHQL